MLGATFTTPMPAEPKSRTTQATQKPFTSKYEQGYMTGPPKSYEFHKEVHGHPIPVVNKPWFARTK